MPRFYLRHVNPGEWVIAGATIFCGGLLTRMDLLLRSDMKKCEKMIQDTHIDVTLVKVDVKDIKSDLTNIKSDLAIVKSDLAIVKSDLAIVKSDVSNVKADLTTTRIDLTNQIQLDRRMAGCSPLSFPGPKQTGGGGVGNSTDCILRGTGCS